MNLLTLIVSALATTVPLVAISAGDQQQRARI
jgi:thiamine pyrophosphate-dependent acetolactate synthase large subunit-like protein